MAIGGELHSDEEAALIEDRSVQEHLWGINLYPAEGQDGWIEFDSMHSPDRERTGGRLAGRDADSR
jgi:hypothetical protein